VAALSAAAFSAAAFSAAAFSAAALAAAAAATFAFTSLDSDAVSQISLPASSFVQIYVVPAETDWLATVGHGVLAIGVEVGVGVGVGVGVAELVLLFPTTAFTELGAPPQAVRRSATAAAAAKKTGLSGPFRRAPPSVAGLSSARIFCATEKE
jgi:hypothetical protein